MYRSVKLSASKILNLGFKKKVKPYNNTKKLLNVSNENRSAKAPLCVILSLLCLKLAQEGDIKWRPGRPCTQKKRTILIFLTPSIDLSYF